jgi:oxygen-independent coproporphyrinogen III oxidase
MSSNTILKYAALNTPRYTSYPTAPHFHDGVDQAVYAQWLGGIGGAMTGSIYLHIPYCREMCWYCGCSTKATRRAAPVDAYVDVLLQEIAQTAARLRTRPRIDHIHFGGGTPTLVHPDQLAGIMTALREGFDVSPTAEIAVEIDPRQCSQSLVETLASLGFNRASLGVQTFDPAIQAKINRIQSRETVTACVERLRSVGINAISLDLLYGLPGETVTSCQETVAAALELEPDRFSVFGYAHLPHLKSHQRLIADADLPGPDARVRHAMAIADALNEAGYMPIGLDHFARADDRMSAQAQCGTLRRNFQGYTTDQADFLIGLGASAIGKLPQGYVQNASSVADWTRRIQAGEPATIRGYALSSEDRLRADIIERLMCDLRVDREAVTRSYQTGFPDAFLDDLYEDGVVCEDGGSLRVPEHFRMLARTVAARFDAHLGQAPGAVHARSV